MRNPSFRAENGQECAATCSGRRAENQLGCLRDLLKVEMSEKHIPIELLSWAPRR
jgi:hypothetical protein